MIGEIVFEVYYGVSSPWAYLGAGRLERIAKEAGLSIHLKPITVVTENGGQLLKTRSDAYQAYHARDLDRTAKYLGIPLKGLPKAYYPQAPGVIELSAQVIIRMQQKYGVGSIIPLKYSFLVQEAIWWTEEGDHCEIDFLKVLASRLGLSDTEIDELVVDRRRDHSDPAVREWHKNRQEAVELGIFGTPNYVVNGEVFYGQDRLAQVEVYIQDLLKSGSRPKVY